VWFDRCHGVGFARELVEHDAVVLGLDGPSELVREGLRLLQRRAREMDVAAAYDEFYLPRGRLTSGDHGTQSSQTGYSEQAAPRMGQ
jgi:hypothetical protein